MNYTFMNQQPACGFDFRSQPKDRKTVVKTVVIDSSKRDASLYPSPSHFVYPVTILPGVTQVRLRNYAIFNSSYVVNPNNNTFVITVATVDYTITLTPGNYTSATLAIELAARLNASGAATYTVTDGASTYKYTIGATAATTFKFAAAPYAAKLLGFAAANVTGTSVTSTNAYSVLITPCYYLQIQEFQTNVEAPCPLYTTIINNTAAGNLLSYSGSYYHTVADLGAPKNIGALTIRLLDYNFSQVDLNGVNWLMILEFDVQD